MIVTDSGGLSYVFSELGDRVDRQGVALSPGEKKGWEIVLPVDDDYLLGVGWGGGWAWVWSEMWGTSLDFDGEDAIVEAVDFLRKAKR